MATAVLALWDLACKMQHRNVNGCIWRQQVAISPTPSSQQTDGRQYYTTTRALVSRMLSIHANAFLLAVSTQRPVRIKYSFLLEQAEATAIHGKHLQIQSTPRRVSCWSLIVKRLCTCTFMSERAWHLNLKNINTADQHFIIVCILARVFLADNPNHCERIIMM